MELRQHKDFCLGPVNGMMGASFAFTMTADTWNRLLLWRLKNSVASMSLAAKRLLTQFCETLPAAPPNTEV